MSQGITNGEPLRGNTNDELVKLLNVALVSYASRRPPLDRVASKFYSPTGSLHEHYIGYLPIIASDLQDTHGQWITTALTRPPAEHELDSRLKEVLKSIWYKTSGHFGGFFDLCDKAVALAEEMLEPTKTRYREIGELDESIISCVRVDSFLGLAALDEMLTQGIVTLEGLTDEEREFWINRGSEHLRIEILDSLDDSSNSLDLSLTDIDSDSEFGYAASDSDSSEGDNGLHGIPELSPEDVVLAKEGEEACPICQENKATHIGFTHCKHLFCLQCLRSITIRDWKDVRVSACSLCRQGFIKALKFSGGVIAESSSSRR